VSTVGLQGSSVSTPETHVDSAPTVAPLAPPTLLRQSRGRQYSPRRPSYWSWLRRRKYAVGPDTGRGIHALVTGVILSTPETHVASVPTIPSASAASASSRPPRGSAELAPCRGYPRPTHRSCPEAPPPTPGSSTASSGSLARAGVIIVTAGIGARGQNQNRNRQPKAADISTPCILVSGTDNKQQ